MPFPPACASLQAAMPPFCSTIAARVHMGNAIPFPHDVDHGSFPPFEELSGANAVTVYVHQGHAFIVSKVTPITFDIVGKFTQNACGFLWAAFLKCLIIEAHSQIDLHAILLQFAALQGRMAAPSSCSAEAEHGVGVIWPRWRSRFRKTYPFHGHNRV